MLTRLAIACLALAAVGAACSSDKTDDYLAEQTKKANENRPKGSAIKVETAVPGGTKIRCVKLLPDPTPLAEALGEAEGVSIVDQSKNERTATSVCSVRKGGERPDLEKQAKMSEKTMKLGVLAGDEICNIGAYCDLPADPGEFEKKCKKEGKSGNTSLGVFSCVSVVPKGAEDSYTYTFIDDDSKCTLRARAGPSVNEESTVQACAKAVMDIVGPDSLQ